MDDHTLTLRLTGKLARCRPSWFEPTTPQRPPLGKMSRDRLAYHLLKSTSRADLGATRSAHFDDIFLMSRFESLLRSDMTPAAALEYLTLPASETL